MTINGGTYTAFAIVKVKGTGLVNFTQTSGGTNYQVNDLIMFASNTAGVTTKRPAEIQVTGINAVTGAVTGYSWVDNGLFRSDTAAINPSSFNITSSGHGMGYAISVLATDASFGVAAVSKTPTQGGAYTALPPIPSLTTDTTTPTASGATVDLSFPTPTWVYGSDDTTAFGNIETWLETDYDRGIFNAAEVPGDHSCLLQTLQINRPVTWRSSGSRQAQLLQMLGAAGSMIDSSRYGFILVAANLPVFDTYQDIGTGQQAVGINNISIVGGTNGQSVYVDGSTVGYTNDGLLFQNPAGKANTNVVAALENVQVTNFPGNALSANKFSGEFRGYNVHAGNSGGNCVDLEHTANPYRFYGLVAAGCTKGYGINLAQTSSEEFHGASMYGNSIDVYVTGTHGVGAAYILFDGVQLDHADRENMYLDQQNEPVICAANCVFSGANENCSSGSDCDAALVIGPDATSTANSITPVIAQFNQGIFSNSVGDINFTDIYFEANSNSNPCNCTVALGGGMFDVMTGTPSTNQSALLTGQTTYAPPLFGNAASIGVPLTLSPYELGIAANTSGTLSRRARRD